MRVGERRAARRARPLALGAAIVLAIGWTATANAATIVVDVTGDAPDGSFDDVGCTLREAVQSANTNTDGSNCDGDSAGADTILLEGGKTYLLHTHGAPEDANVSGDLDITGGGGTTIRSIGPGLATIDADSTLIPGDDSVRGRAIEVHETAGAVTIERARVINGAVTDSTGGGGIRTEAPLNLIDSDVSGNNVAVFAGAPNFGGGGILVRDPRGALTMTGTTVAGNRVNAFPAGGTAARGGGITYDSTNGSFTATNSTITGNRVDSVNAGNEANGGGIFIDDGQAMTLTNVTVADNAALGTGFVLAGGIALANDNATIRGSILAGNQAPGAQDCGEVFGTHDLVSLGGNLLGAVSGCGTTAVAGDLTGVAEPGLGPLSDFGGPTRTMLPNPGSPAIDRGGTCPVTDQRGRFRAPAAPCDAGAVEAGATSTLPPPPPPPTPPTPPAVAPSNEITFGKATKDKKKGTATLAVSVAGAGELALAGDGLKSSSASTAAAGEVTLDVKATGKAKQKLRRKGKKVVEPQVTFTPAGGAPNTESTSVKLVRR